MNKHTFIAVALSMTQWLQAQTARPVGINLSGVADYSTEFVFTNAFRQCREWISCNADDSGPWDTQISIPLRSDGYPSQIPYNDGVNPPQKLKTLLLWDLYAATPTGTFRLKSSGTGQISLSSGAWGTFSSPVDTLIPVTGGVILTIEKSDADDPVRDIRFILPKYVNSYANQTFTSELKGFLKDFQVIRFMDFTHTNNSTVQPWSGRTLANHYTQSKATGAAWEYAIQLANETQKDAWINIPHEADDTYIGNLAILLKNTLHSTAKIYIEYSNELWNGLFTQNGYAMQMGQARGYTGQPWEKGWKFTAARSAETFVIFKNVFGGESRLVKVIPSQAGNSWLGGQLATYFKDPKYNPTQIKADAIAIAPYFGNEVADNIVTAGLENTIAVKDIIDSLRKALKISEQWIIDNKNEAMSHNLGLVCYEGGQHLVATGAGAGNALLTQKLIDANRDTAMQTLYCRYFDFWYQQTGSLLCHFNSTSVYSEYGSWGLKETQSDTLNPKYIGMKQCVFPYNGTSTQMMNREKEGQYAIYPNPVIGWLHLADGDEEFDYLVFNALGMVTIQGKGNRIDMSSCNPGVYLIRTQGKTFRVVKE